jgi:nitroreductase
MFVSALRKEDKAMELRDLVLKNRSFRRFHEEKAIDRETLTELVDLGRLSASGGNLQPLKYMITCDAETNARVFPCLAWAGFLEDWPGPAEGERPSAYITILCDTGVSKGPGCDHGIAAQSILLGAAERGLGGCMIGSIQRDRLREVLGVPAEFKIPLVVALGHPAEKVVLDEAGPDGDIKYWRDDDDVHHVPKRPLDDVIVEP